MTTSPQNICSDSVIESYLFIAAGFRLIWRTTLEFDETRPTVLFHLKEFNGLEVGDQVKLDFDLAKSRNFHSPREEDIRRDCEDYNRRLIVGRFVKLKGSPSKNHESKEVSIEHIFAILVSCKYENKTPFKPLTRMDPPDAPKRTKTEKILLFWTETLKKV